MVKFNSSYFFSFIIIFIIEVCIALFVHDNFIRPYLGDVLVVILIYCFVKSFWNVPVVKTSIAVLLFAFAIETLQYFSLVEKLNLQDNKLAKTVIGTSFAWEDIWAYVAGIAVVIVAEKWFKKSL